MERETGFEPATNSLEGCDSTPELLPPASDGTWWRREDSNLRRAKPGRFTVCCHCPLGHTSKEPCQPGPGGWSRHPDLNRGPTVYKTVALPLSYAGGSCPRTKPYRVTPDSRSRESLAAYPAAGKPGPASGKRGSPARKLAKSVLVSTYLQRRRSSPESREAPAMDAGA